jgi:hypothetical protein
MDVGRMPTFDWVNGPSWRQHGSVSPPFHRRAAYSKHSQAKVEFFSFALITRSFLAGCS